MSAPVFGRDTVCRRDHHGQQCNCAARYVTGDELKAEGMAQAEANDYSDFGAKARWWVSTLKTGTAFTSEDCTDVIGRPASPQAIGPAFSGMAREGLIVFTMRWQKPRRPERHATPVRVWRKR